MAACGLKGTSQDVLGSPRLKNKIFRKEEKIQGSARVGGRDPLAAYFAMHDSFKRRLHEMLGRAVPVTLQDPSALQAHPTLEVNRANNELFDKSAVEMLRGNHRHSSPSSVREGVHGAKAAISSQTRLMKVCTNQRRWGSCRYHSRASLFHAVTLAETKRSSEGSARSSIPGTRLRVRAARTPTSKT